MRPLGEGHGRRQEDKVWRTERKGACVCVKRRKAKKKRAFFSLKERKKKLPAVATRER